MSRLARARARATRAIRATSSRLAAARSKKIALVTWPETRLVLNGLSYLEV